eukprot:763418-Hanusia_phi.AAC.23
MGELVKLKGAIFRATNPGRDGEGDPTAMVEINQILQENPNLIMEAVKNIKARVKDKSPQVCEKDSLGLVCFSLCSQGLGRCLRSAGSMHAVPSLSDEEGLVKGSEARHTWEGRRRATRGCDLRAGADPLAGELSQRAAEGWRADQELVSVFCSWRGVKRTEIGCKPIWSRWENERICELCQGVGKIWKVGRSEEVEV